MGYKLKNNVWASYETDYWKLNQVVSFFVIVVSITMYYDEEHSKLFTAFNHQVIK